MKTRKTSCKIEQIVCKNFFYKTGHMEYINNMDHYSQEKKSKLRQNEKH